MKSVKKLHSATGPWVNFHNANCYNSPEVAFTKRFINIYRNSVDGDGVGIREFQVQGLGIADFLWVQKDAVPKIIAFELKLKCWQRGLLQAYRYSFFSDESYLVVPQKLSDVVLKHIDHFRDMNIGLIGFEEESKSFTVYQSPPTKKYSSNVARARALKSLIADYNLGFLAKHGDCLL